MATVADVLKTYGACDESIRWAGKRKGLKAAWDACERGDWLLWIAARLNVKREVVVLAACQCARLALKHVADPHALTCIETAETWTRGAATIEQVKRAAHAAYDAAAYAAAYAAYAAAADAAYAAYDAAADAAYAAYDDDAYDAAYHAAYAAADAADAYAAYDAAADAAAADTREKTLKECARIVRKHVSWKLIAEKLK